MKKYLLLFFLVPFLLQCQQQSPEISQWRGPDRDGFYPDKNLLKEWPEKGPKVLWSFEELGIGYSSVAIAHNKIYTTGTFDSTSYLFALSLDGELLWKKEYGLAWMTNFPGVRSTPLIYNDYGYLLSGRGKLICFRANDGEKVWEKDLFKDYDGKNIRFGITENLLIDDNKLFCTPGGTDANVIALNPLSGELIWKSKGNGEESAYCSPRMITIDGKKYFITITAKSAICLDPENGELVWSYDLQYPHGIHGNTPFYHDGYLFTMNGWGFGSTMLKITNGGSDVEEVWKSHLFDLEHGDVLKIGDNIYGADYTTRHFSCVDWKTGAVKDSIGMFAPASVISADGMIYLYAYDGDMALIKPEPDGFDVVSRFKAPGEKRDHIAHPVIHNGRLYLRYSNMLLAYNISEKKVNT